MNQFRSNILNSMKFNLYKLKELPLAYFAGLKVKEINSKYAIVTVKHNHITKNPFKSMYFAAQAMAAELSTGVMVLDRIQEVKPKRISMLVVKMNAEYLKKAKGLIEFKCENGADLDMAFNKVLTTNQGDTVVLISIGTDESGDVVSKFSFTWSLKQKKD